MNTRDSKVKILEAVITLFNDSGLKFTMDDVAKAVGMSKKTIYVLFRDKEDLFYQMVDYCFDSIKESEQEVLDDPALTTPERIRAILGVMPDRYKDIDLRNLYILKDRFPAIFAHVQERLENDWEPTLSLLRKGMEEGSVRQVSLPIFKMMLEAAIEQFFQRDVLIENHLTYNEGLAEVVRILVDGILVR
jgi:AcrR family transcriptional regulator